MTNYTKSMIEDYNNGKYLETLFDLFVQQGEFADREALLNLLKKNNINHRVKEGYIYPQGVKTRVESLDMIVICQHRLK